MAEGETAEEALWPPNGRRKRPGRTSKRPARSSPSGRDGENIPRETEGLSTAEQYRRADSEFAFPKERKEPLTDARHVRNAIARFDQVEGVSDAERDQAWQRILAAAKRYDVDVSESSWRYLARAATTARTSPSARPPDPLTSAS